MVPCTLVDPVQSHVAMLCLRFALGFAMPSSKVMMNVNL